MGAPAGRWAQGSPRTVPLTTLGSRTAMSLTSRKLKLLCTCRRGRLGRRRGPKGAPPLPQALPFPPSHPRGPALTLTGSIAGTT